MTGVVDEALVDKVEQLALHTPLHSTAWGETVQAILAQVRKEYAIVPKARLHRLDDSLNSVCINCSHGRPDTGCPETCANMCDAALDFVWEYLPKEASPDV